MCRPRGMFFSLRAAFPSRRPCGGCSGGQGCRQDRAIEGFVLAMQQIRFLRTHTYPCPNHTCMYLSLLVSKMHYHHSSTHSSQQKHQRRAWNRANEVCGLELGHGQVGPESQIKRPRGLCLAPRHEVLYP